MLRCRLPPCLRVSLRDMRVAIPPSCHKVPLMRQAAAGLLLDYDPTPGVSISTLAYEYPAGFNVVEHAHGSDQLIYAPSGVMEVAAGRSLWLIPPQFAVWIPAQTSHKIRMPGAVSMRTLYLRRGLASRLPRTCSVLHVTTLLRELIIEAARIGKLQTRNHLHRTIRDLIVHELQESSPVPTFVTLPSDSRALAVARATMVDLAGGRSLSELCTEAGASVRTIERAFRRDVGTSFELWRRQARLMKAIELLVAGHSVKQVAYDVGYRRTSAFVEMFRHTMGTTPKTWTSGLNQARRVRQSVADRRADVTNT
jgi:AraC-like DNA-binding protein/quercetin dioxygenase-like cupin family protein